MGGECVRDRHNEEQKGGGGMSFHAIYHMDSVYTSSAIIAKRLITVITFLIDIHTLYEAYKIKGVIEMRSYTPNPIQISVIVSSLLRGY